MTRALIHEPIQIIPSDNYNLAILDGKGRYHYFNIDGTYDGFSQDVSYKRSNDG